MTLSGHDRNDWTFDGWLMVVSNSKSGDTKWLHHCSGSRSWPTKGPQLLWNSGRFSSCSDSRGSSQLGSWDPHNEEPKLWLLRERKSSDVRAVAVKSYLLSTVQPVLLLIKDWNEQAAARGISVLGKPREEIGITGLSTQVELRICFDGFCWLENPENSSIIPGRHKVLPEMAQKP